MLFSGRVRSYKDAFFNAFQRASVGHYFRYMRNSRKTFAQATCRACDAGGEPDTPRKNGLSLYFPYLPPSTNRLSHTQRTVCKIYLPDTLVKWTISTFPTCHPSTNGLGHTQCTWRLDILTGQNLRTETRSKQQQFR